MRDVGNGSDGDGYSSGGVLNLALEVIGRLAAQRVCGEVALQDALLSRLVDTVTSSDPQAMEAMSDAFRLAKISPARIADGYIPEAARRLGVAWEDDTASFADVTIGVARLQAMLRDVGFGWVADDNGLSGSGMVLMLVPPGEQHTLGAMVATGWLRRRGISVCLRISPTPAELASLLTSRRFDGAFVSIGSADRVEISVKLIKTLHALSKGTLRVAVGGAAVEVGREVLSMTDADIVTNDLEEAISMMGLTDRKRDHDAVSMGG